MTAELPDGDLVRLARDGDMVAFRLLVERHQPAARARAVSLCGNPSDVDDVVRESFLRAFIGLDGLRDPDRFAGWLAGISDVLMLADDAGRRELPVWSQKRRRLAPLLAPRTADRERAETVDEFAVRLLRAAGARVTGVDIDELGPEVTASRIALAGPAGTGHVTARVEDGLAVAVAAGVPVRVAGPMMDRLAVPLPDDGGPVPLPEPAAALAVLTPHGRPRYEPRNMTFADGLDRWRLGGSFTGHPSHAHWQGYASTAEDGVGVLSATVPQPAGFAFLGQEILADDYRGAVVTFRGEFRTEDAAGTDTASRAGLFLRVSGEPNARNPATDPAAAADPDNHLATIFGNREWTSHQVTARVREDSTALVFGVFLAGPGGSRCAVLN